MNQTYRDRGISRTEFALMLVVGLCFAGYGTFIVVGAVDTLSWPSTTGIIIESYVQSHRSSEGGLVYSPMITYDYAVDGVNYSGNTVHHGGAPQSNSLSTHQKIVDKYPINSSATVYYDPSDPSIATLEVGFKWWNFIILVIGLLLSAYAFYSFQPTQNGGYIPKKVEDHKSEKLVWDTGKNSLFGILIFIFLWYVFSLMFGGYTGFIITSILFIGWRSWLVRDSRNWPVVEGKIITSYLKITGGESTGYSAIIYYQYTVNGEKFGSEDFDFPLFGGIFRGGEDESWGRSSKQRKIDNYPVGSVVKVFYNPKKPELAVINPGYSKSFRRFATLLSILLLGQGVFNVTLRIPSFIIGSLFLIVAVFGKSNKSEIINQADYESTDPYDNDYDSFNKYEEEYDNAYEEAEGLSVSQYLIVPASLSGAIVVATSIILLGFEILQILTALNVSEDFESAFFLMMILLWIISLRYVATKLSQRMRTNMQLTFLIPSVSIIIVTIVQITIPLSGLLVGFLIFIGIGVILVAIYRGNTRE